ncbi:MAG TPA: protein phosphatase 2C domain-containing protein [Anaerolineaceae bacterium]|nr:protein phosphatase 2C domain-containing protein [Anaerolineaceae bacterium]
MIRKPQSRYPVVAKSHPGMSGKNNEDRFGVTAFQISKKNPTPVLLAVLSDGVGGHKAGEIAAELAVDQITQTAMESNGLQPIQILKSGIERASNAIYLESQKDTGKQGMAATVAVAWMIGHRLFTTSIGDSRIYLIHKNQIRQLSIDHTWIQEALDNNILTPDQVEGHPNRHVIRRYLGGPNPPEVDFRMRLTNGEADQQSFNNQGYTLQTGDRLLLTSDGLTDLVTDEEILAAFEIEDDDQVVNNLIELANQRGGHDNITIITFVVPDGIQAVTKKRSFFPLGCILTALLVVIIAGIIFSVFWLQRNPVDFNFFRGGEQPSQVTLNPMLTSAPQTTATPNNFFPTSTTLSDVNMPNLVPTSTVQPILPQETGGDAYPSPQEAVLTPVTPQAYP